MDKESNTVCAVIVTYNRKELLLECLDSMLKQSYPVRAIYLIDNASTDGTFELLKEKGYLDGFAGQHKEVPLHYVKLPANTGGAGGFYEGIKRAHAKGYRWLWLMDDDTIPGNDALCQLITAYETVDEKEETCIMASKVLWTDGKEHSMNIPSFNFRDRNFLKYSDHGILAIRAASFVSILLKDGCIKKFGLPIKEYFIWNDDAEYTSRILKTAKGFFVNKSTVLHKTKTNYVPWESVGDKYYYEVRNKLWAIRSSSYYTYEKLRITFELLNNTRNYLIKNGFRGLVIVMKGLTSGLFHRIYNGERMD